MTRTDRAGLLHALATLPEHPNSLPINDLMPIPGTPLGTSEPVDGLEFVRMVADNLGTQDRVAFLRELGYVEK